MVVLGVVLNAAVTWGIVKTQLQWLRRDVDELREERRTAAAAAA